MTMGANNDMQHHRKWENTVIFMLIIPQNWYITWKDTPFSVSLCLSISSPLMKMKHSPSVQNSVQKKLKFFTHHCHHGL